MRKKPFNWIGFTCISVFAIGLILFCWGIICTKDEMMLVFLCIVCSLYFIFGGIIVFIIFLAFDRKLVFNTCPELKEAVKVISKISNVSCIHMPRSAIKIPSSNSLFIAFEFPDGSRKNFRIADVNVFNMILENDTGMLKYKEHGKYTLFIEFQNQPF